MPNNGIDFKTKEKSKINRNEITNNKPTHIKFNFSFITTDKDFSCDNKLFIDEHKLQLLQRVIDLSKKELIQILAYPKNIGLEYITKENFKRKIDDNEKFNEVEFRKKEQKYSVIRLYPNNNPLPARIVGKLINNVFYIMYIDLNHKLYS